MDDQGTEQQEAGHGVERILVALDPSAHSLAALKAAAVMAARFEAKLLALFVEDVNVRRLTEIPFVQEVGFYTGSCRRVETRELSRQLRVQAGSIRRHFRRRTQHIEARCTFREIRGRVASEVLKAAAEADVIILGKGAWSAVDTGRLAPEVRQVLGEAPASTLVLQADTEVEPPVRVVYTGTPLAQKALSIAAKLAEDGRMLVFVLADDPDRASGLREQVREHLEGSELRLTFETLTEGSVARLAYLMAHEERGTLVLPTDVRAMKDEVLLDFLDETNAPVLLVR